MNFIERLFAISPDGGSGLFELLLFLIPVALWLGWRRQQDAKEIAVDQPSDSAAA